MENLTTPSNTELLDRLLSGAEFDYKSLLEAPKNHTNDFLARCLEGIKEKAQHLKPQELSELYEKAKVAITNLVSKMKNTFEVSKDTPTLGGK